MEFYDYTKCVTDDIEDYLGDRMIDLAHTDIADLIDKITNDDNVTGCGSGSYTMSTVAAEQNLVGNYDILRDAVAEIWPTFNLLRDGPEAADSLIRQYLVPSIVCDIAHV